VHKVYISDTILATCMKTSFWLGTASFSVA